MSVGQVLAVSCGGLRFDKYRVSYRRCGSNDLGSDGQLARHDDHADLPGLGSFGHAQKLVRREIEAQTADLVHDLCVSRGYGESGTCSRSTW